MESYFFIKYDGWLIHTASEKRAVNVKDFMKSPSKRSLDDQEKIDKDVLDIILVDDTGLIMVSLWGSCVESFLVRKS